ncbi:MAG: hypothetical protein PHE88_08390 [Elusimicrobia bacterium]|nr:hypothetical protein [Elusimicrobiota bacterium]
MNYVPLVLAILLTIAALFVFLKEQSAEKEKKSKLYSIPSFIVAIILIWGNFGLQVYKDTKQQSELRDLNNLLKNNSKTINSLTRKLDESIENNNKLNKQKKIELLKNMKNEIDGNVFYLKDELINKKEILSSDNSAVMTQYRFSVISIEKNISEGTVADERLMKSLHSLLSIFNINNKMLEYSCNASSVADKNNAMRIFFDHFSDERISWIENISKELEKYIKTIDK